MSELLSAELAATCSALGYYDPVTKKYFADNDTLETVKDLIRYLRRDDENHEIRRQLGNAKVLQTDLLPMLRSYWEETELFDVLLRLLVNLTTPAIALWNDEMPKDKITRNYYMQIEDHLKSYKEVFADQDVWSALSRRLSMILEIDYAERGNENSLIIERILILLRNILYVPIEPYLERPDDDASIHDQVLWALHQSGMLDIILYMSSAPSEQAYYIHILEILYFMLREQKASDLARAALQRSETEKIRDEAELLAVRHKEAYEKQQKMKKYAGARHSRFGGTFVVKSMKSISNNELIYHKPLTKLAELNFDTDKKKVKTPKNRMPITGVSYERRSAFTIRLFLKEFCIEFLNGAYNTFMNYIKHALVRGQAQDNDGSYYFWAMRFFMEMNRCYKFDIKLVSETMSLQSFHYVQREIEKYFDMMQTDKKNVKIHSKRLHIALLAYRELLYTLCAMDKSSDESVRSSSRVIKSNIFYVPEYRELLITLLIIYDELKSSDLYLNDLIETQHIFFKLLEKFCCSTGGVVVRQKVRKPKKKAVNKSKAEMPPENLDAMWDEIAPQLSVILESGANLDSEEAPFDAASDIPIDEQKTNAMRNIQRKLKNGEFESAIGLLHASRNVWPENDEFGNDNMTKEEEFLALKDIFFANIDDQTNTTVTDQPEEFEDEEEEDYDDDEAEKEYKIEDFIKRLAHPKVVRACSLSLKNFETNSINTNLCTIKLLHRIAFDCKMYVMLFQLSIFRIFQRIFKVKELPQYKELVKFAVYIIRQFFKVAEKNKKVYIETLFWKSSREAYEIEEGYGCHQQKSSIKTWTEQDEDELRRLFMEHREKQIDEDVVDWITANLIDNTRSRKSVLRKLKEMMLITDHRPSRPSVHASRIWTEEEEAQLEDLYNQFKDANDPIGCIMERMNVRRSKPKIIEKLLVMGLISDKKEVRKKRAKKSGQNKNKSKSIEAEADESSENEINSEGSETDDDMPQQAPSKIQTHQSRIKQQKKTTKKSKTKIKSNKQEVTKLLLDLSSDMNEALEWLKDSFSDALEDIADIGEDSSLPLVPIMDYAIDAIEDLRFQQLLRAMGLAEPFQGQEIYWRIPETMSVEILTVYIDLLSQAIEKTLQLPETSQEPSVSNNTESKRAETMDNLVEEIFEERHIGVRLVDSESEDEPVPESNHSSKPGNAVTASVDVYETESIQTDYDDLTTQGNLQTTKETKTDDMKRKRIRKTVDSGSEDEIPNEVNDITTQGNLETTEETKTDDMKRKRIRKIVDSGSEDEIPTEEDNFGATSIAENESESAFDELVQSLQPKRPSKRLKIIDSDEED